MLQQLDPWRMSVAAEVLFGARSGAAALARTQALRLAALLKAAREGSPLYRRLLAGLDLDRVRLDELPATCKRALMDNFDDWVTDRGIHIEALQRFTRDPKLIATPYLGRYTVWESSGSSGEPGVFVQDEQAMAVCDALESLRRRVLRPLQRVFDPWLLGERIAFVGATSGHFASTVSIERLRRLSPVMATRMKGISFLQPIGPLVAELQAFAPTVIATYPSAAVLLAQEQQAGRLKLRLNELWTGGETLSPAARRHAEQAFACPSSNSYGASEFLSMASECTRGSLHLNADWVILEPVDAQGHAMPPGQAGFTTLLTNLANHTQPLIRYDIGDRVAIHPFACACGSSLPVIDVQGRCDDTLRLGRPRGQVVSLLPLALTTVLEDEAGLFDFQLVQRGPCDLLLSTGLSGTVAEAALAKARSVLASFLTKQGANHVRIRTQADVACARAGSGKTQRVIAAADTAHKPA